MASTRETVLQCAADLDGGKTTSRALVEEALARIANPAGEGSRSFLKVYDESAKQAADAQDSLRGAGYKPSPLAGLPISVKDLFDIAGDRTLAGAKARDDAPVATRDAAVVARLKAAGAIIVGRTNMTEFAFSGVGINPHFGTPGNPWDRKRIPGGSSSGAGVAVADGQCIVGIGSDTGGSVRIPSALCGITGFKPTQKRVPLDGAFPLSTTLDSIGPLANSVACCVITDAIMAGETPVVPAAIGAAGLRLAIPRATYLFDDLDAEVAAGFERACETLERVGARLTDLAIPEFADYAGINAKGGFSPPESCAVHAGLMARRGADYDQRIRQRIARGVEMTAPDYVKLVADRAAFIARVAARTEGIDALLVPTVAIIAPPITAFAEDADFFRLNAKILRNPNIVNFLDRCAITLPISQPGEAPVGVMLIGEHGGDKHLLAIARGVEAALGIAR